MAATGGEADPGIHCGKVHGERWRNRLRFVAPSPIVDKKCPKTLGDSCRISLTWFGVEKYLIPYVVSR